MAPINHAVVPPRDPAILRSTNPAKVVVCVCVIARQHTYPSSPSIRVFCRNCVLDERACRSMGRLTIAERFAAERGFSLVQEREESHHEQRRAQNCAFCPKEFILYARVSGGFLSDVWHLVISKNKKFLLQNTLFPNATIEASDYRNKCANHPSKCAKVNVVQGEREVVCFAQVSLNTIYVESSRAKRKYCASKMAARFGGRSLSLSLCECRVMI